MSDALIAALLDERRGYVARGLSDRVKLVDAELAALGHKGAPEKATAPEARTTAAPKPRARKASA